MAQAAFVKCAMVPFRKRARFAAPEGVPAHALALTRERLLVVEGKPLIAMHLGILLEKEGATALPVSSVGRKRDAAGASAAETVRNGPGEPWRGRETRPIPTIQRRGRRLGRGGTLVSRAGAGKRGGAPPFISGRRARHRPPRPTTGVGG